MECNKVRKRELIERAKKGEQPTTECNKASKKEYNKERNKASSAPFGESQQQACSLNRWK
jgi:hypothetical protein